MRLQRSGSRRRDKGVNTAKSVALASVLLSSFFVAPRAEISFPLSRFSAFRFGCGFAALGSACLFPWL
jgi:hypothetical protein